MKALSVRQPWAWLLFHGKPIENRDWPTAYRGPLAIHASASMSKQEWLEAHAFVRAFHFDLSDIIPRKEDLVFGAVIGTVNLVNCVSAHTSPWFVGDYGFVFREQVLFPKPIPARGALGFWEWDPQTAPPVPATQAGSNGEDSQEENTK